jgi:sialate O-acetylesterase
VLRVGPNVIAVRVIDLHGEGGFCGKEDDMRIGPPGADVKTCATVARTWKYKVSHVGAVPPPPPSPEDAINPNTPSVLFNGMLNPLIPFRIAGAIWYQGESNCDRAIQYRTLFPAMIRDWRAHWKQGDFPFYYVQIAPYSYGNSQAIGSALLREAQLLTLKAVPNVGMAVTMDIGEENDIHPKNKRDVGKRLSLWALACTYGMDDIVYSGPLYRAMKVQGEAIRISFDYVGSGLVARGGPLTDFEIAGIDRKFVPANAEIQSDNAVLVSSPQVPNPVAVRYAFRNWAQPNLFNAEGLPASSFRTDNWPIE